MPDKNSDMDPHVATMWSREDRDLLIELKTRMEGVGSDIKDLKETMSSKENDHEARIRALERQRWLVVGGATTLATAVSYLTGLFIR